eukprot:jgi/Mesen1/3231/ME000187S02394
MAIVTGDGYLDLLGMFVERNSGALVEGSVILKLNPVGLLYLQSRLEALRELEDLRANAPVDYLRAYVSDLGDYHKLEKLRKFLKLLEAVKVVSLTHVKPDLTPVSLLPFKGLRVLELRGCDLSRTQPRGLLHLRPQLEHLTVCNSASGLRHIFAERTVDVRDAQVWPKLRTVLCPSNGMQLMDDALTLLPALQHLNLSRNAFQEVGNLHCCSALTHLDLSFNVLTSVSGLPLALRQLRRVALRHNRLACTQGLETLPALHTLDLAHNLLSCTREVARLRHLPHLSCLHLAGNPLALCHKYRPQMLSLFANPSKIELDGQASTATEIRRAAELLHQHQHLHQSFHHTCSTPTFAPTMPRGSAGGAEQAQEPPASSAIMLEVPSGRCAADSSLHEEGQEGADDVVPGDSSSELEVVSEPPLNLSPEMAHCLPSFIRQFSATPPRYEAGLLHKRQHLDKQLQQQFPSPTSSVSSDGQLDGSSSSGASWLSSEDSLASAGGETPV